MGSSAPAPEDRGAFEAEAVAHLDGLYATAVRLTRDPVAAQDLVQDTFVKALRARSQFEPGTNLRAWLFTILHNTFRNDRRDAGRDPVEVDSEALDDVPVRAPGDDPESLLMRASVGVELKAALASLPEEYRLAVWLRDAEEFSYAEIAKILDVPIGTVMSRIARGRRRLFARLTTVDGDRPARPAAGKEP
jgi:RNA polymerase sigma-70 factor (ECF subfamily)